MTALRSCLDGTERGGKASICIRSRRPWACATMIALWLLLIALEHYHRLYEEVPGRIEEITRRTLYGLQETAETAMRKRRPSPKWNWQERWRRPHRQWRRTRRRSRNGVVNRRRRRGGAGAAGRRRRGLRLGTTQAWRSRGKARRRRRRRPGRIPRTGNSRTAGRGPVSCSAWPAVRIRP